MIEKSKIITFNNNNNVSIEITEKFKEMRPIKKKSLYSRYTKVFLEINIKFSNLLSFSVSNKQGVLFCDSVLNNYCYSLSREFKDWTVQYAKETIDELNRRLKSVNIEYQ